MKQVVIENPVLNSPFEVPQRHFKSELMQELEKAKIVITSFHC